MDRNPQFAATGHWQPAGKPNWYWDDAWVKGDYQFKSQAGRWDAVQRVWVRDEDTSLCIDAGEEMTEELQAGSEVVCAEDFG